MDSSVSTTREYLEPMYVDSQHVAADGLITPARQPFQVACGMTCPLSDAMRTHANGGGDAVHSSEIPRHEVTHVIAQPEMVAPAHMVLERFRLAGGCRHGTAPEESGCLAETLTKGIPGRERLAPAPCERGRGDERRVERRQKSHRAGVRKVTRHRRIHWLLHGRHARGEGIICGVSIRRE